MRGARDRAREEREREREKEVSAREKMGCTCKGSK
jgi:hypothetical protein